MQFNSYSLINYFVESIIFRTQVYLRNLFISYLLKLYTHLNWIGTVKVFNKRVNCPIPIYISINLVIVEIIPYNLNSAFNCRINRTFLKDYLTVTYRQLPIQIRYFVIFPQPIRKRVITKIKLYLIFKPLRHCLKEVPVLWFIYEI